MSYSQPSEEIIHETETSRVTSDTKTFYLYHLEFGEWKKVNDKGFKEKKSALSYYQNEFAETVL